jgi:hypothetical protein
MGRWWASGGPVVGVVQAHDLGEDVGVAGVGLGPGRRVSFPVAGHRHRVDRIHLVAGRDQSLHPRTPVGLDPDPHPGGYLVGIQVGPFRWGVLGDQRVQTADPVHTFR